MTKAYKHKPIIVAANPDLDTANAWLKQFTNLMAVDYKNGLLDIEVRGDRTSRISVGQKTNKPKRK